VQLPTSPVSANQAQEVLIRTRLSPYLGFGERQVTAAKKALQEAQRKAALAMRAEEAGRQGEALRIWREVLGVSLAKTSADHKRDRS